MTDLEQSLLNRISELEKTVDTQNLQIKYLHSLSSIGEQNRVGTYGPLAECVSEWTRQLRHYRCVAIGMIGENRPSTKENHDKLKEAYLRGVEICGEGPVKDVLFWL